MTIFLIVINFVVFSIALSSPQFYNFKFGLNSLFLYGMFWQPLTSMFMHGNLMHLMMNMVVLYHFGRLFEMRFGKFKFLLIYLLGGILTSLLSYIFVYFLSIYNHTMINMVGASGAICVLLGMVAFLDKTQTKELLIAVLAMSFLPILMDINVAWYAHIIGFGVGYFSLRFRLV